MPKFVCRSDIPAGFVNAIDEHYASDCAKKWQSESGAEVVLMGVLGSVHTHFIYVGYKNNEMLEKGRSIVNSCPETAMLIKKLAKHSESTDYVSRLGEQSLEVGDWTNDKHFMKFDFNVELGKAPMYAKEWTKMMNSLEQTNSAGLITHRAGNGWMSHFVYVGGDEILSNFSSVIAEPDALTKFSLVTSLIVISRPRTLNTTAAYSA